VDQVDTPQRTRATRDARIEERAHRRRRLLLVVLCTASFVVVLDNTVLAVAIPTISRELRTSPSELNWIIDSYTLVFAGLLIAGGAFADRIGRRVAFRIGIATFGIGSLAAALSQSAGPLIMSRAFMGIGAAVVMPAALSTLRTVFQPPERVFVIGVWGTSAAVASVTGPLVGGVLLEHFAWGSIFLINVPVVIVMLAATYALIPRGRSANRP
jgi:MFS family permease